MDNSYFGLTVEEVDWLHEHGYSIRSQYLSPIRGTIFLLYHNERRAETGLEGYRHSPEECYNEAMRRESAKKTGS